IFVTALEIVISRWLVVMSKIKRCTTRRNKAKWTPSSAKRIAQGWRGGGEQPLGLGGCHKIHIAK
ncbi:MAG: hypothetical protein ABII03_04350, partial [Nanoarchaeota archaeon]